MMLNKYKNEAAMKVATETPYQDSLGPAEVLRCNNKIPAHDLK